MKRLITIIVALIIVVPVWGQSIRPGSVVTSNINGVLYVGEGQYANIASAVTAAGSNQALIVIPSNYAGVDCPAAASSKLTFLDYRGGLNICTQNSISYGTTSGSGLYSLLRGINTAAGGVTVAGYFQNFLTNATGGVGTNADGGSLEADVTGTLTGTFVNVQAAENPVIVQSTGGTITSVVGQVGYVNSSLGSTTNITTVKGTWGLGCNAIAGSGTITNCYGTYSDEQTHGATRNYALAGAGLNLLVYGANFGGSGWDVEDNSHVPHHFLLFDSSNNSIVRAIGTNGIFVQDSTGVTQQLITATGTKMSTGIGADGSGFKHKRFGATTATTASANAVASTTYSWTTGFADTSYTPVCSPEGTVTGTPVYQGIISFNTSGVTVQVMAATAAASSFGGMYCHAVHD